MTGHKRSVTTEHAANTKPDTWTGRAELLSSARHIVAHWQSGKYDAQTLISAGIVLRSIGDSDADRHGADLIDRMYRRAHAESLHEMAEIAKIQAEAMEQAEADTRMANIAGFVLLLVAAFIGILIGLALRAAVNALFL